MSAARKRTRRAEALAAERPRVETRGAVASPRWSARAPLLAAAVAAFVYAPSLAGGFLYDDQSVIVRNAFIRDLSALRTVLSYEPSRPLLNLTWAVNYALGGLTAWPYHATNVLIHAANAALLASLFLWMGRRSGRPDPGVPALLGACFFAASPMAAETVAYVASRSSALVALFSLASLRVAVGALESGSRSKLLAAIGLFVLALATKEEAAAVPVLLILLDYFFVAGQRWREVARRALAHAAFWGLVVAGLLGRRLVTGAWLPEPDIDPGLYLLTQWAAFPLYFFRSLVPMDPAFYRYHIPAPWPPDGLTVALGLLTTIGVLLAFRRSRDWPEWSFAVLCLGAGLLPSSSVVALQEMVVDHRAYLGSFGIAFAVGGLLFKLGGARLGILVVALLAARSVHYQWVLGDPVRAWEDAVRRSPGSPDALCALGEAYAERDDPRAEELFRRAAAGNPRNPRYWANLGTFYAGHQRLEEAAKALQNAARLDPRNAAVRDYLGQVLQGLGREDEAAAEFEAAIAAEPDFALALINLAASALRKGDKDRARALLEAAERLRIEPVEVDRIAQLRRMLE